MLAELSVGRESTESEHTAFADPEEGEDARSGQGEEDCVPHELTAEPWRNGFSC